MGRRGRIELIGAIVLIALTAFAVKFFWCDGETAEQVAQPQRPGIFVPVGPPTAEVTGAPATTATTSSAHPWGIHQHTVVNVGSPNGAANNSCGVSGIECTDPRQTAWGRTPATVRRSQAGH